ncbi:MULTISPECIES: NADPH-dependent F420 reductase [Caldilinea]|jgi:NADPH-dependent F420 reductase|uniref:Putative F420-dependent NADPH reductase n=1 Tax=Caldilinea aerophila (strain DSM 14535 / JCM 11387 / NBRC 104270 / STL-6-O1) TaxID=926550 RepID=I0HZR8_CALAS|nr:MULTISPECIES: NADPH-dependent F420 reductase [Caldilinea]MBO9392837.1 NADPH-dependent F420 reductase [Caldilinea sp.]BAL98505.1 putative F420-dependent NADPH reductase [Caldilinea aerophila DSM 14535 = NBRC 104270]GIV74914.1 MAG: NADPH-dependent F420 reductase [Caldilinea sp.]
MSKPVIGVIGGTGAEGSGLVVRWAAAGYPVIIGSRSREKAQTVAAELMSLLPVGSAEIRGEDNASAAAASDVIVLSVPYNSQADMAAQIAEGAQGKVVITVVVPLKPPRVSVVWRPEAGSAAEELQRQLGEGVQVVAAFQNIAAGHLRDLSWQPDCDVLYTGDNKEAKAVTLELIRAAGFFGIDAGPLANSSVVEGLTAVLIGINIRYKVQGSGIRITGIPR